MPIFNTSTRTGTCDHMVDMSYGKHEPKERPIETNQFESALSINPEKILKISFRSIKEHCMKRSRPIDLQGC